MKNALSLKRAAIVVALLALAGAAVASTRLSATATVPAPEAAKTCCPGH